MRPPEGNITCLFLANLQSSLLFSCEKLIISIALTLTLTTELHSLERKQSLSGEWLIFQVELRVLLFFNHFCFVLLPGFQKVKTIVNKGRNWVKEEKKKDGGRRRGEGGGGKTKARGEKWHLHIKACVAGVSSNFTVPVGSWMQPVSSGLISFLLHFESGPVNPKLGGKEYYWQIGFRLKEVARHSAFSALSQVHLI